MGKIGAYQPIDKYKNYLLPTAKPLRSHPFYKEKVWTLQEQIHQKLKKVSELLESLYPTLADDFSKNVRDVIEENLKTLIADLGLMQSGLQTNPNSFNTEKLKTNQHCITQMKNACATLQTVRSYEHEFKKLGKIKHTLHELEHLIQPTSFERSLEKARAKSKAKTVPAKKEPILVKAQKKLKEKSIVNSKKQKAIFKQAKPAAKLLKPVKISSKQPQKSASPIHKLKQSGKKDIKSTPKLPAKHKNALTAKPKSTLKPSVKPKTKLLAKSEKALETKSKPKIKSTAVHKKKS